MALGFPMPALYVENLPAGLHKALKRRAKAAGRSLSAEVISILKAHVPTHAELALRRQRALDVILALTSRPAPPGAFETAEEMIRADRSR